VARAWRPVPAAAAPVTASASAAVPSPAAVAAAPAAAAVLAGLGLVDGQVAALELLAGQGRDRRLGLLVGAHLHEAEAAGPAGVAVHHDLGGLHPAVLGEQLVQVAVGHAEGEVADVQLLAHLGLHGVRLKRYPG
jgi:hypothetical protein